MPTMFWILYLIAGIIISTAANYLATSPTEKYSRTIKAIAVILSFSLIIPIWPVFAGILLGKALEQKG